MPKFNKKIIFEEVSKFLKRKFGTEKYSLRVDWIESLPLKRVNRFPFESKLKEHCEGSIVCGAQL